MVNKKINDEIVNLIREYDRDPYRLSAFKEDDPDKLVITHIKCGSSFRINANELKNNINNNIISCNKCREDGYRISREKNFKNRLLKDVGSDYKLIGDYIDGITKVKIHHNVCDTIFTIEPKYLLSMSNDEEFNSHKFCPICKVDHISKPRTKSMVNDIELEDSMVTELRNGDRYIVTGDVIISFENSIPFTKYDKSYNHISNSDLDIIKVYDKILFINDLTSKDLDLIWFKGMNGSNNKSKFLKIGEIYYTVDLDNGKVSNHKWKNSDEDFKNLMKGLVFNSYKDAVGTYMEVHQFIKNL